MKTNELLQKDVQDAIKWEPLLNAAEIGVIAKDGIVTLTGVVDSYAKKMEAEEAVKKVIGVKAVVEKIEIKIGVSSKLDDTEIARELVHLFNLSTQVPHEKINIKVEDGCVTLSGELNWNFQKEAAHKLAVNLTGVKWVTNDINLRSDSEEKVEKTDIENALTRNWSLDDKNIRVEVVENKVILKGTVNSWYQKDEACRIAWNAPGVVSVNNELIVV